MAVSIVARLVSGYAVWKSSAAARASGVIQLHNAWEKINDINPANPVGPDVRNAVNALDLTATLWRHRGVDREIIFEQYGKTFQRLYESVLQIKTPIPGYSLTGPEVLPNHTKAVYAVLKRREAHGSDHTTGSFWWWW